MSENMDDINVFKVSAEHPVKGEQQKDDLVLAEPKTRTKRPPFYKVVMLNDDYTPMDFVVKILMDIFRHSKEEAINIMLQVHRENSAICGIYTRDVAETKIDMVIEEARKNEYPLQCAVEKE